MRLVLWTQSKEEIQINWKCSDHGFPALHIYDICVCVYPEFISVCSPTLMTSEAELHHISLGLLLCLSLIQISRHCSLCGCCLVVAVFPRAKLSGRFPLKSACQRPATPSDFHHVNPRQLFIAQRSISSFRESNFSDGEAKCSNFATRKKKNDLPCRVFSFFSVLLSHYEKVEKWISLIDIVIHPNYHHLLINLTLISSFTKRTSLNLSPAISLFITKVTTCLSRNIHLLYLPSN